MFYTRLSTMLTEAPPWIVRAAFDRRTVTLLSNQTALGDTLMITPIVRNLKKVHPEWRIAVATRRPDIFLGNPCVDEIRTWHLWNTRLTVRPRYHFKDVFCAEHFVRAIWRTLWHRLHQIGVPNTETVPELDSVSPELVLRDEEKQQALETLRSLIPAEQRDKPVVMMISGGSRNPVHNREWGAENYQAVADALAPHATVLQLGGDVRLTNGKQPVPDLSGRPVRETGALMVAADAVLLHEGGLHHLARAVNAPSVVIFGGSIMCEQTGYDGQLNLANRLPCAACFASKRSCLHLKCMTIFSPQRVLKAVAEVCYSKGRQLPPVVIESAPDQWIPPSFVDRAILEKELEADRSGGQARPA